MIKGSGSGSGRHKVIQILRIRIHNTEPMGAKSQKRLNRKAAFDLKQPMRNQLEKKCGKNM
jgi:hypothetical protein